MNSYLHSRRLHLILISIIGIATYVRSLANHFSIDDPRAWREHRPAQALAMLEQLPSPVKLQVMEVNYLYGVVYRELGESSKGEQFLRRAAAGGIELGIVNKGDINSALTGQRQPVI